MVGSPNVVYETHAPPVPMRVIIRPPGVVPGLADIDVRVLTNGVRRVTVLPVHWRAGVEGAPPPDVAQPVEGEPNLYHAQLWLMVRGAYSVHVEVETANGTAKVIVPVEKNGVLCTLEPYMGMLGHAAIQREDGTVFTHLHPAGSVSIAAQQVFQIRSGERPPKRITPEMMEKLCQPQASGQPQQPLVFPYEFPKPGRYRLWVQAKIDGRVCTGVFATEVLVAN